MTYLSVFEDPEHILTDFLIGMEATGVCPSEAPNLVWVPDSEEMGVVMGGGNPRVTSDIPLPLPSKTLTLHQG